MEEAKNIRCANGESAADHMTLTRWFLKISLGLKELRRSGKIKLAKKPCIPRLYTKPKRQIRPVVFAEYQASSDSHAVQCVSSPSRSWQKYP